MLGTKTKKKGVRKGNTRRWGKAKLTQNAGVRGGGRGLGLTGREG